MQPIKEILIPLINVVLLSLFTRVHNSKYMKNINLHIDAWSNNVKKSPRKIGEELGKSILVIIVVLSLLKHVPILESFTRTLIFLLMTVFLLTLCVNYHVQNDEISSKEFALSKLSKMKFPLIILFIVSIICGVVYVTIIPSLYSNLAIAITIGILIITSIFTLQHLFSVIVYYPSKLLAYCFTKLIQEELSAKFVWKYLSISIILNSIYSFF